MQLTFGDAQELSKTKRTRREVFLEEMDQVVVFEVLCHFI